MVCNATPLLVRLWPRLSIARPKRCATSSAGGGSLPIPGEECGGSENAAGTFQRNSYAGSRLVASGRWRVQCFPYRVDHSPQRSIEWRRFAVGLLRLAGTTYGAIHRRRYAYFKLYRRQSKATAWLSRNHATQGASQALPRPRRREGGGAHLQSGMSAAIASSPWWRSFRRPIRTEDRTSRSSSTKPKLLYYTVSICCSLTCSRPVPTILMGCTARSGAASPTTLCSSR